MRGAVPEPVREESYTPEQWCSMYPEDCPMEGVVKVEKVVYADGSALVLYHYGDGCYDVCIGTEANGRLDIRECGLECPEEEEEEVPVEGVRELYDREGRVVAYAGWSPEYGEFVACPFCGAPMRLVKTYTDPLAEGGEREERVYRCPLCGHTVSVARYDYGDGYEEEVVAFSSLDLLGALDQNGSERKR